MITLRMNTAQAQDLADLLDGALGDLSHEIAATDNAEYRVELVARRGHLVELSAQLRLELVAQMPELEEEPSEALVREIARPGD